MLYRALRLGGLISLCLAAVSAQPPPSPAAGAGGYAGELARADSLMRAGESEAAIQPILAAHAAGMPRDSLYWLLSETARRRGALDTAMGFNLAIPTPAPGAFRDSVLWQRYRLYAAAGLSRDAASLRDSLPRAETTAPRRPIRLTARAGSGWFAERNSPAHAVPFGAELGGYAPSGPEYRLASGIEAPFARAGGVTWLAAADAQGVKSYAKDSVDSRLGATVREEGWLLPELSLGAGVGGGRITGSGWVASCKGEASWLSLGPDGFTVISAGIESEWDERGRDRYQVAWLAWYRDLTRGGRGFAFTLGLSAFRSDPLIANSVDTLIYVDDARAKNPVHYSDASYDSAISASRFTRFAQYRAHGDPVVSGSRSPQSFFAFSPQASYTLPLPGGFAAEIGGVLSGSWFPEPYRRDYAPLPSIPAPAEPGALVFRGLARSRADGREYAVVMRTVNGGMEEFYGAGPLRREERARWEGQGSAQVTLRRSFKGWGALSLRGVTKRYESNLGSASPIWIPEWDVGAALDWNGAWEW